MSCACVRCAKGHLFLIFRELCTVFLSPTGTSPGLVLGMGMKDSSNLSKRVAVDPEPRPSKRGAGTQVLSLSTESLWVLVLGTLSGCCEAPGS